MEKITLNRHDLLSLRPAALAAALEQARCNQAAAPWEYRRELVFARCPAIVRRQEAEGRGSVDVGFSSPRRMDGLRCRYASEVPVGETRRVLSPYDVMEAALRRADMPGLRLLRAVREIADGRGVRVGLFGSYAMEVMTGLPYVSESSDLDLLLSGDLPAVRAAGDKIEQAARHHGVRTDMEIRTASGFDVKQKELFAGKQTVLGKSLTQVELLRTDWKGDYISISLPRPPDPPLSEA